MCSAGGAGAYHDRYDTAAKNEEIGQHEGFQREGVSSLCFFGTADGEADAAGAASK
jgi:hypothetical protein